MKSVLTRLVLLVMVLVCPAAAQPLVEMVPADAIVYVGWQGSDALTEQYRGSHLKAVLDNSKLRELFTEFVPALVNKMGARQPGEAQKIGLARSLGDRLWRHPTALWFAGIDPANAQGTMPKIALICRTGADTPAVVAQLNGLLAEAPNSPVKVQAVGDHLLVTVGYPDPAAALPSAASSLARAPAFANTLRHVQPNAASIAYIDVEKGLALLQEALQAAPNPQAQAIVPSVIDVLGLRGLKRIVCTDGFDGADWASHFYVEAPAPRTGIFELLDGSPIPPDLISAIPADATFASTVRFDAAKFVQQLRTSAEKLGPQARQAVEAGLSAVQLALARNPVTDILEPMGQDWAMYCSPTVAGNGFGGLVIVNRLDDPAKATMSLPIAWTNLNNWIATAMMRARAEVTITGQRTEIDGQRIYYLGTPMVAPAWTIRDRYLFLGMYPQTVAAGARFTARSGKSLAENEKFIALQKRLGVTNPCSFSFYDLPTTAAHGQMYQQMMGLARLAGFADMFGVPMPEPLVPPLDVLIQHLSPAGSFAWVDDSGYHVKSLTPFPGAGVFAEPSMMSANSAGSSAVLVSVLLPSLNRARETANRVKCAANLKSIGQALLIHANQNQGRFPQSLGELTRAGNIMVEVFVCPSSDNEVPAQVRLARGDALAAWVDENSSYVYLGRGKAMGMGADDILIYEKSDNHGAQGMNILFGDGHVDFMLMDQAMQMIERQAPAGAR